MRVFSNFKKGIKESDLSSAFEVRRVYLGYSGNISQNFSADMVRFNNWLEGWSYLWNEQIIR